MRTESQDIAIASMEKRGRGLPEGATDCPTIHVRAARGIWPSKTAECWAAAAGVQPRMAKYWLAGYRVSDAGRLAIIRLLT
jgi:hypothetical protein